MCIYAPRLADSDPSDSSLVGVAVMLAFLPIPGAIAKNIQRVQREVMKRTDARVQVVTESK